jgi:hypothetical protein
MKLNSDDQARNIRTKGKRCGELHKTRGLPDVASAKSSASDASAASPGEGPSGVSEAQDHVSPSVFPK